MAAVLVMLIVFVVVIAGMWSAVTTAIESGSVEQTLLAIAANVLGVFAVLAATYLWLNSHNLKFYLWLQRQRHKFFPSKSSTWDIQASWLGSEDVGVLTDFEDWLKQHYSGKLHIWKQYTGRKSYQVDGRFNVETSSELSDTGEDEPTLTFGLRIYALTVNFAESKDVLGTDVMPLLEKMAFLVRPLPDEQAYNLTMTFTDNINPFLGLYIQGLHPREIQQFQITVTPHHYDKETRSVIKVSPEKLSITARSPRVFESMAQDFLSFAPRLAKTT